MLLENGDEYHKTHAARLTRTAELLVQHAGKNAKILELGTSGYMPLMCKELIPGATVDVTTIDLSLEKETVSEFALGERVISLRSFNIDLEYTDIPEADGHYDMALCCEVLEHMEIDPMFMLSNVNRVLREGGTLILTTPNITSSRALKKILSGVEPHFYMQYHRDRSYHRHNFEYSAQTLGRLLVSAGFAGKVWSEDLFEDGISSIVEKLRLCGFPVAQPGDNLLCVATKVSGVVDRYPIGIYV